MTELSAPAEHRSGRMRSLLTYPLRLGPPTPRFTSSPFSRLAAVHACSSAGDALVTVALAGSVFASVSLHAARGRTAVGLLCTVVPFVVVGPFLGPVIDRLRGGRRVMVVLSALGRAGACLLMAKWVHSLLLFPAAFLSLTFSKTYLVAKASVVPNVVERKEQLVQANAKLAVGSSVVTSLAGVAGAGVYRALSSAVVLQIDAVLLTVCAVLAMRIPAGRSEVGPVPSGHVCPADGWPPAPEDTRRLPPGGLALAAVLMASMRAVAGLMTALVIFGFRRDGAPLIWYGLVAVASVGGNLGGAALAPLVRQRVLEERIIWGAALLIGAAALAVTQVDVMHRWPAALILGVTIGLSASVAKLAFDAIVQRDAPAGSRSRIFARFETLFQLVWVLAALVPVLIAMSLIVGFVLVAVVTLVTTAGYFVGLDRARRGTLPEWWPGRAGPGAATAQLRVPPVIAGSVGGDVPGSADGSSARLEPPPFLPEPGRRAASAAPDTPS